MAGSRALAALAPVAALAILLAPHPPAAAQPDEATGQVREQLKKAREQYDLGHFREAAGHYEEAHRVRPLPAILFNLGQCYRNLPGLEDKKKAVFFYRRFLWMEPKAPNRLKVEQTISELEKEMEKLRPAKQRPGVPAPAKTSSQGAGSHRPAPARPVPIYKQWWFWSIVGAVVVGTGVGLGVGLGTMDTRVPEGPDLSLKNFKLGGSF